jgi:tetratricopeptide (TPR) repeat protein
MNKIILTIFATFILNLTTFAQPSELLSPTAKAEFEKQNFEPCIAEMSKMILAQPKNDTALVERARCLFLSADDNKDEERILDEKLKTIPDKALAEKAASAEIMSRRNKAVDDATKAIVLNPKNANAFNIRGLVKSSLGRKEQAESIADFDKAIELNPKFIKPYFNRGVRKADDSDYDGAIADFTKVIALDPNNIAAMENRVAAMISKSSGKPNLEAFNELKAIIKLSPNKEQNYFLAGTECFNFPNKYECVNFFKQYTAAFPKSYEAFLGLARANASVEYYSDVSSENRVIYWKAAADSYQTTFKLKPNEIQPYIEAFDLVADKFRIADSAENLSLVAVGLFPDDPRSYIMAGRAAGLSQKYDKAVTDFTRAIELRPTFSLVYSYRAEAFYKLKNFDKAIADANKAIELDGKNGMAFKTRGNVFNVQKKYQEAIADFTEADRRGETCAKTYRGVIYGKIALDNKELRNSENFAKAHQDFINDDARKCYDTNFQYGLTLYGEAFNKEAAEQFNLALAAYKKFNYDTAKIVEWQNRVKTAAANAQANPVNPRSQAEQMIEAFKQTATSKGFRVISSGVTDAKSINDPALKFNVSNGENVLLAAVKDYDPTFGFDIYTGSIFIRPTHNWDDKNFVLDSAKDYGMRYTNDRRENLSIFQMSLGLTKKSNIRTIQFMPAGSVGKIPWVFMKAN